MITNYRDGYLTQAIYGMNTPGSSGSRSVCNLGYIAVAL